MAKQINEISKGRKLLDLFMIVLLLCIFLLVIYSAMQEGNHKRRVFVPEALEAPYQPYRPSMRGTQGGHMMPIDSMMRDLYVVQREINQGSHQLYLFFDTFTHRPAPLNLKKFDLKNPQDAQWYNFAIYTLILLIVVVPTITTFLMKKKVKGKIKNLIDDKEKLQTHWMKRFLDFTKENRMMIVIIVFMIAILLSMVNLSIPLDKEFEYRADPFFVIVCFSSIAVSIVSIKYVLKGLNKIKVGGDTSLVGKNAFRETLVWGALGVWALGFMCYFIGMYSLGTQKSVLASIVRPALESSKMFVLSDSVKEISFTLRNNGAFMGFYTLCKLIFLLISSFALVSLAWSRINSYWSIWDRRRGPGDLYVFFGINDNTKILAHDIAKKLGEKLEEELEQEQEEELKKELERKLRKEMKLDQRLEKELKKELKKQLKQKRDLKRDLKKDQREEQKNEPKQKLKKKEKKEQKLQLKQELEEQLNQALEQELSQNSELKQRLNDQLEEELQKELDRRLPEELEKKRVQKQIREENRKQELRKELKKKKDKELKKELKKLKKELKQELELELKLELKKKPEYKDELREKLAKKLELRGNELKEEKDEELEQELTKKIDQEKNKKLEQELKKRRNYTIVMVENRNSPVEGMGNGVSISSLTGMFNFRKDAYAEVREISNDALLVISDSSIAGRDCSQLVNKTIEDLSSGKKIDQSEKYELFNSLGLKHLSIMIKNATNCHFFFLDDDDRVNIDATDNLRKMLNIVHHHQLKGNVTIYCLARKNAFSTLLETPLHSLIPGEKKEVDKIKVKILDLSVMAALSLFKDPNNHPINFVECDTETAIVKSSFESLVIGFGRGGRDIVRYLYEFGAFFGYECVADNTNSEKQKKPEKIARAPFRCTILDKNKNMIEPRYMAKIPAVKAAHNNDNKEDMLLCFKAASLNSEEFVTLIEKKLGNLNLNFVVISMGNDKTNLGALTFIIYQVMRIRKGKLGKLKIFVRNYDPDYESTVKEQAEHFNQLMGGKVISIFGNRLDLLTFEMTVDDKIEKSAKEFFKEYNILKKGQTPDWDKRHDEGRGITYSKDDKPIYNGITWQKQSRVMRQETQDIINGMHIGTKLRLIGLGGKNVEHQLKKLRLLKDAIKFSDNGCKYEFTSSTPELEHISMLYENLARNEHIRRTASLEMMGYTKADPGKVARCDEEAKVHPCMVDWEDLDEATRYHNQQIPDHPIDFKAFNYLVVKTAFELAYKELKQQQRKQPQTESTAQKHTETESNLEVAEELGPDEQTDTQA